jgi:hypothetical protein
MEVSQNEIDIEGKSRIFIGMEVSVYWSGNECWFGGTIKKVLEGGEVCVEYHDGDQSSYTRLRLCDFERPPDGDTLVWKPRAPHVKSTPSRSNSVAWTAAEEEHLRNCHRRYGEDWGRILEKFPHLFPNRSLLALKYKWKRLRQKPESIEAKSRQSHMTTCSWRWKTRMKLKHPRTPNSHLFCSP